MEKSNEEGRIYYANTIEKIELIIRVKITFGFGKICIKYKDV